MFGRKKMDVPVGPRIRDPFAVVPLIPPGVELRRDSAGLIQLRLALPVKGLKKRIADWLGHEYSRKVALDEYGTLYFSLVDGRRTLRVIVDAMMEQKGGTRKDMEERVILFTRVLMTRAMIVLEVPREAQV